MQKSNSEGGQALLGEIILRCKPIQKFIDGLGEAISEYVGKDKTCIIGLEDDGVFYGEGIYRWLKRKGKDVTFTTMNDTCRGLEGAKARGRKILLVDNYIITGTGYRKVLDKLNTLKEELKFKEIKFAVVCDRKNLADFAIEGYTVTSENDEKGIRLDRIDFEILQMLNKNGRKSFVDIAKETNLTPAAIQKRVLRLVRTNTFQVKALVNTERFYTCSARVDIEADSAAYERLVSRLKSLPFVFYLTRAYASYNLSVGILGTSLRKINECVEKEIRRERGVRRVVVHLGELPIVPRFVVGKPNIT